MDFRVRQLIHQPYKRLQQRTVVGARIGNQGAAVVHKGGQQQRYAKSGRYQTHLDVRPGVFLLCVRHFLRFDTILLTNNHQRSGCAIIPMPQEMTDAPAKLFLVKIQRLVVVRSKG